MLAAFFYVFLGKNVDRSSRNVFPLGTLNRLRQQLQLQPLLVQKNFFQTSRFDEDFIFIWWLMIQNKSTLRFGNYEQYLFLYSDVLWWCFHETTFVRFISHYLLNSRSNSNFKWKKKCFLTCVYSKVTLKSLNRAVHLDPCKQSLLVSSHLQNKTRPYKNWKNFFK